MAHLLIWFIFRGDLGPTTIFRARERYVFIFLNLKRLSRPINNYLWASVFEHPIHDFSIFRLLSLASWERSGLLFQSALLSLVREGSPIGWLFTETALTYYPSGISLGRLLNWGWHTHTSTTCNGFLDSFPWCLFLLLTCASGSFIGFNFKRLVVKGWCGTWLLWVRAGQEDSRIGWSCLILGRTCQLSGGLGIGSTDLLRFVSCILRRLL